MRAPSSGPEVGIVALAELQRPPLDRLPALQPILGQLATALTGRLAQLAGDPAELRVEAVRQRDLADCLADIDAATTLARFECLPLAGVGLIGIEDRLLRPLLDLALGGKGAAGLPTPSPRPATPIEARLTERLVRHLLADLAGSLGAAAALDFRFDRLAGRGCPTAGASGPMLLISLQAAVRGAAGGIVIVLPAAAVDRLRVARADAAGAGPAEAGGWAARLLAAIGGVDVELEAVLHEGMVGLGFAQALEPGQTLAFDLRPDAALAVRCQGIGVGTAVVACRDDRLVLSVERAPTDPGASP